MNRLIGTILAVVLGAIMLASTPAPTHAASASFSAASSDCNDLWEYWNRSLSIFEWLSDVSLASQQVVGEDIQTNVPITDPAQYARDVADMDYDNAQALHALDTFLDYDHALTTQCIAR